MKTLKLGNKVKVLTGVVFKNAVGTIDLIGQFDKRKRYCVVNKEGLCRWCANKDLQKL